MGKMSAGVSRPVISRFPARKPAFSGKIFKTDAFKCFLVFVFLAVLRVGAFGDSSVLQLYKQKFSRDNLAEKARIIESAKDDITMYDYMGQFYEYVLQFAYDNSELLKNEPDMIKIIDMAVIGIQNTNHKENLDLLWKLFQEYQDLPVGADIIIAAGRLGRGNRFIIENVNGFLTQKNILFRSGENVNYAVISAGIAAIMELGDDSSFPVLFETLLAGFPEVIAMEASAAFDFIAGDLKQFLYNVIEKGSPLEKYTAFKIGINSSRLALSERGQLAELALEQSLVVFNDAQENNENADLAALRYAAVLELTELGWTRANPLAIRNYYRMQTEMQHGLVLKERFIEAIDLLGAVGNSDAALTLGLQLGLINARTAGTGEFDEEITLAIVRSLGLIGDKAAFEHLLDVQNLPYTENIRAAAREAVEKLRW